MAKVLHFFKTYYPQSMGGIEQVIFQLAEGCIAHGIESEVLYLSRKESVRNERLANHVVHRSRLDLEFASTGFSVSAFADFKDLARHADIIHYHFPWPYMDLLHLFSGFHKPTLVTYHSDIVRQKTLFKIYRPLMRRFLSSVHRIVATSPNYVESSPTLRELQGKVSVVPIGLAQETYPRPEPERVSYWKSRFGGRFFLFVGRLRYYKGLGYLLEALRQAPLPVVIIGSGPMESELKAKAAQYGLKNVFFLGSLPDADKTALLTLCYGLVFPSHLRSEAFGISLLEAAMWGKPMICCEIGTGTTYINRHNETGLVVPPADSSALAAAMRELWENPLRAEEMGRRAASRFQQLFTAEAMAARYADIYRSLL